MSLMLPGREAHASCLHQGKDDVTAGTEEILLCFFAAVSCCNMKQPQAHLHLKKINVFNRRGVAGAVLQTAL